MGVMDIRRLMMIGNIPLPSNVRAYKITINENTTSLTVQHDLGVIPASATLINLTQNLSAPSNSISSILYNSTKEVITRKEVTQLNNSPNAGQYSSSMPNAEITSTQVVFAQSQYYSLTYRAGNVYLCIIVAEPTT